MILWGPCLTMALSALALVVVVRGFRRTAHARLWAVGCALGAAQWGSMGLWGLAGWPGLHGGGMLYLFDLLGLGSLFALAGGFGVRATGRLPRAIPVIVLLSLAVLAALLFRPQPVLRAAVLPLASALLFAQAAVSVFVVDRTRAATETAMAAVLAALTLLHATASGLALAEWAGAIARPDLHRVLYLFATEPACAAVALTALLLIAADFSAELRHMAHTDPLTGVLNRAGFDRAMAQLWRRGRHRPLAIAVIDIDRFKQVNDGFGHQAGDGALAGVARGLADGIARDGLVARIGGEEFAVILPGLDAATALARVEPLRRGVEALRLGDHPGLHLSASFGVAQRHAGETATGLLERADRALYRSKRDGRNRVTLAGAAA